MVVYIATWLNALLIIPCSVSKGLTNGKVVCIPILAIPMAV